MLEFQKFKKQYLENLYSLNKIEDADINKDYTVFTSGFNESKDIAMNLLEKQDGYIIPLSFDDDSPYKDMFTSDEFEEIQYKSLRYYLEDVYGNERIDDGGICLKSKLIGSACQMIHNEDLLGVVKGFDEKHPNILFVDFGEEDEVKVDIDELIIAGQKNG